MKARLLNRFTDAIMENPLGLNLSDYVDFKEWLKDEVERLEEIEKS